jgi:RhtB (resistance to homoserine/threonine) family protein
MLEYLPEFLTVALVHIFAAMSPGPDFVLVSRNTLVYSRKIGIFSAIGIALGILIHVAYSLIGIGLIISQSIILFSIIKFIGAGYLIYIGYKSLTAYAIQTDATQETDQPEPISNLGAVWMGILTNALNPKATLFFLSLFTQIIDLTTPLGIKVLYSIEMFVVTFLWFALVAVVLSNNLVQNRFVKVQKYVGKIMGATLIALGVKVALSKN